MTFSRITDCFYGAQFDPGNDEWLAIKVYRDGNRLILCRFATQEEAEDYAAHERVLDLAVNSETGFRS